MLPWKKKKNCASFPTIANPYSSMSLPFPISNPQRHRYAVSHKESVCVPALRLSAMYNTTKAHSRSLHITTEPHQRPSFQPNPTITLSRPHPCTTVSRTKPRFCLLRTTPSDSEAPAFYPPRHASPPRTCARQSKNKNLESVQPSRAAPMLNLQFNVCSL